MLFVPAGMPRDSMPVWGSGARDWGMEFRVSVVLRGEDQAGRRMWKLKGPEAEMV